MEYTKKYRDFMLRFVAQLVALGLVPLSFVQAIDGEQYPQPKPAQQWGYSRLSLATTFDSMSSIDIDNTKRPGFSWYTNNAFPNIHNKGGTAWSFFADYGNTAPSSFTISNGALSIDWNGQALNTCVWTGSSVAGKTFGGGFYVDIVLAVDLATAPGTGSWPGFWLVPAELLDGTITTQPFVELDGLEAMPGRSDDLCDGKCAFIMTQHEWTDQNSDSEYSFNMAPRIRSIYGKFEVSQFHHYGYLWVPMELNKGTGLIENFVDGENVNRQHYSSIGAPSPALTPSNPVGAMSEMDSMHYCLMIDAGQGFPIAVQSVAIWQRQVH